MTTRSDLIDVLWAWVNDSLSYMHEGAITVNDEEDFRSLLFNQGSALLAITARRAPAPGSGLREAVRAWADKYLVGKGHANALLYEILAAPPSEDRTEVERLRAVLWEIRENCGCEESNGTPCSNCLRAEAALAAHPESPPATPLALRPLLLDAWHAIVTRDCGHPTVCSDAKCRRAKHEHENYGEDGWACEHGCECMPACKGYEPETCPETTKKRETAARLQEAAWAPPESDPAPSMPPSPPAETAPAACPTCGGPGGYVERDGLRVPACCVFPAPAAPEVDLGEASAPIDLPREVLVAIEAFGQAQRGPARLRPALGAHRALCVAVRSLVERANAAAWLRGRDAAASLADASSDSDVCIISGRRYLPQYGERGIGKRIRALTPAVPGAAPANDATEGGGRG